MKRAFRSGYEKTLRRKLDERGVDYEYEGESFVYDRTVSSGACRACGSDKVVQIARYTPDFTLRNGIRIEAKGYLDAADRAKLRAIRRQYPDLDLRLVFQRDNVIKQLKKKPRYSEWAKEHGFKYAIKDVPESWLV